MSTARAVHPGAILREEFLAPLNLRTRALAVALQAPAPYINGVVHEKRDVTPDFAQQLARYFDTTPQFWTDLQASYDAKLARRSPLKAARRYPRTAADRPLPAATANPL